jgi:hypothetical protein
MSDHTDIRRIDDPAAGLPLRAALAGVAVVVALAALTRFLEQTVPAATKGTAFAEIAAAIEFPVYAILLGLLGNLALTRLGLRDRPAGGFRTEVGATAAKPMIATVNDLRTLSSSSPSSRSGWSSASHRCARRAGGPWGCSPGRPWSTCSSASCSRRCCSAASRPRKGPSRPIQRGGTPRPVRHPCRCRAAAIRPTRPHPTRSTP